MKMKSSFILIPLLFLFLNFKTSALIFNEIMYDPAGADTDREWIELLNESNNTVDLTSWKFFEANTNHGLSSFQGSLTIPIGGYVIIANNPAKFLEENVTFQGSIVKASFSLSNSGEYIAIKNNSGSIQDSLTYIPTLGGQDDGTTLSFIGGAWARGEKTPGAMNIISTQTVTPPTIETKSDTVSNTNIVQNTQPTFIAPAISISSDLNVSSVNEKIVLAGADAEFVARASIAGKKVPENAEFIWSFGDGGTRSGKSVGYHYQYPGTYVAMVEVSADGAVATSKTRVKVIAPELSITDIGKETGKTYIEISNNSSYEVDLSNWMLSINQIKYPLPRNTIIMGKQKVRFAGSVLGFASLPITSTSTIKILYPDHTEMLRYIASTTEEIKLLEVAPSNKNFFKQQLTTYKKVNDESKMALTMSTSTSKGKEVTQKKSWFARFLSKL